jgi:hypothetical protein
MNVFRTDTHRITKARTQMKLGFNVLLVALVFGAFTSSRPAFAESQQNDYKGITDPFGDPATYEFAEDEKEDKEFFHLGRFLMFGLDVGAGIYTGGLGSSNSPGLLIGAHLIYFFDRAIALEAAGHYSFDVDSVRYPTGGSTDIDTGLIPLNLGFRYYFDTQNAPKAIAVANPYLSLGGGIYLRSQKVTFSDVPFDTSTTTTGNFGAYAGAGVQFLIYRRHIYLGIDLRYHLVFFNDESSTFSNRLSSGARGGDFFTSAASITYSF